MPATSKIVNNTTFLHVDHDKMALKDVISNLQPGYRLIVLSQRNPGQSITT